MLTQKEQEQLNRLLKKRNQAIREQKKNRKIFEDECKKTFGMPVEEVSYKLSEYEKMVREKKIVRKIVSSMLIIRRAITQGLRGCNPSRPT